MIGQLTVLLENSDVSARIGAVWAMSELAGDGEGCNRLLNRSDWNEMLGSVSRILGVTMAGAGVGTWLFSPLIFFPTRSQCCKIVGALDVALGMEKPNGISLVFAICCVEIDQPGRG